MRHKHNDNNTRRPTTIVDKIQKNVDHVKEKGAKEKESEVQRDEISRRGE